MKILHINLERGWRGGERQTLYLMQGLRDLGHESWLLARSNREFTRRVQDSGFPVRIIPKPFFFHGRFLRGFDIIQTHEVRALQLATLWKWHHKRPVVYTRRVIFTPGRSLFTRYKYHHVDRLVANSSGSKDALVSWGFEPSRITVINSVISMDRAVDTGRVDALRRRFAGKTVVGCVSSLEEEKDHHTLMEAARRVRALKGEVIFVLVGDGSLRRRLEEEARTLGQDAVFFEGYQDDPDPYYAVFDAFVLTSRQESFSNAILDAFLYKVPVVACATGGIPDLVIHGQTGLLAPVGDPGAVATALLDMLKDDRLRARCVKNAYEALKKNYTVPVMARAYESLYLQMLDGPA